jgi:hypothetical protein
MNFNIYRFVSLIYIFYIFDLIGKMSNESLIH